MGSEGSTAAMITSLRNNKNLRLKRRKLFSRENRNGGSSNNISRPLTYKHLSEEELTKVRKELATIKKSENRKKIIALSITLAVTTILVLLIITYFDPLFEFLRSKYFDFLEPDY
ncbi:MAG: hypothetical protein HQ521_09160 [Bacteroidetes bacterium]|nr:hypothetical protein [Bacteroidota bacterium]